MSQHKQQVECSYLYHIAKLDLVARFSRVTTFIAIKAAQPNTSMMIGLNYIEELLDLMQNVQMDKDMPEHERLLFFDNATMSLKNISHLLSYIKDVDADNTITPLKQIIDSIELNHTKHKQKTKRSNHAASTTHLG
jgi:uncharacterized protein YerC